MWSRYQAPLFLGILIAFASYLNKYYGSDFNALVLLSFAVAVYIAYDWLKMLLVNRSIFPNPHWLFVIDERVFPKNRKNFLRTVQYRCGFAFLYQSGLTFLYRSGFPFRSLMRLEGGATDGYYIHLLAHNLKLDTEFSIVRRTVRENLKKGVRYNFIISPHPDSREAQRRISEIHRDAGTRLTFTVIPQEEMNKVAAENIMIIVDESAKCRGFIQIPEGSGLWWAEMSQAATALYYSNLRTAMDKRIEDKTDIAAGAGTSA
jgi:hypothetical protein